MCGPVPSAAVLLSIRRRRFHLLRLVFGHRAAVPLGDWTGGGLHLLGPHVIGVWRHLTGSPLACLVRRAEATRSRRRRSEPAAFRLTRFAVSSTIRGFLPA